MLIGRLFLMPAARRSGRCGRGRARWRAARERGRRKATMVRDYLFLRQTQVAKYFNRTPSVTGGLHSPLVVSVAPVLATAGFHARRFLRVHPGRSFSASKTRVFIVIEPPTVGEDPGWGSDSSGSNSIGPMACPRVSKYSRINRAVASLPMILRRQRLFQPIETDAQVRRSHALSSNLRMMVTSSS
jgi:hypothetical protein